MFATARVDSVESESRPIKTFLNSGFTAFSNEILDNLILKLPWAQARLLIVICRFSTGYLREWCYIGEQKLIDITDLSRSSLYSAKIALQRAGIIEINHSKRGHCLYRLHYRYQALKTASEGTVQLSGPSTVQSTGPMKESKDNLKMYHDHHHDEPINSNDDEFLLNSFSNWKCSRFSEPSPGVEEVSSVEVETEPLCVSRSPQLNPTSSLTRRLLEVGVNAFMARRMVQTHSEALIFAALERLKLAESIKNPAAYLVSELSRGGYAPPSNPLKGITEKHEQIHHRRRTEKLQEERTREASNQAAVTLQLERFQQLPPLQRDLVLRSLHEQAERERFHRLPGWGPEHPVWKGLLAEIVRLREERASLSNPLSQGAYR